ncbi:SusC/RagA family TonB-linked outer membrane protein [Flavitalea sp.]|nr:SusC/RagA family TonB-linked outer membrane protein [Flavitalea sp.]
MNATIKPIKLLLKTVGLLPFFVCVITSQAQNAGSVATGIIKNSDGEVLSDVVVTMQNSSNHPVLNTTSNEKGIFILDNLQPGGPYRFIFSHVGYIPDTLSGYTVTEKARISLSVNLKQQSNELNEVVVTALGIRREEKSLGYAAQTIKANAVTDAKTPNWINSLSGKVAGLTIQGAGAGPIGSSRITLRGESSLNLDNNQALIIIDGVPVSKRITGTGFSSNLSADNPVDFGSDLSDINPDDIEKVTVLKGAGATALYGSRAAGGVILITTKSGQRKERGIGITFNSNVSMDQVNRWPDYQYEYGEGRTDAYYSYLNSVDGSNTSTTVAAGRAFGPRFNGQSYFQYNPNSPDGKPTERTPWVADKDYITGFFKTGLTVSNSISIDGGNDKGSARLSLTHLKNEWILPNTGFERINAALSVNQKISDKLKISGRVNYTNKKSDNLPGAGYNNQSMMYFLIIGTTPNIRPEWFKPYWQPGLVNVKQKNPFNTGPDNPYLDLYEMLNKINKHGVIGTISANYQISPRLELMLRSGTDMSYEYRSQQRPFSMTKFPNGMFREQSVFNYEINTDALLTYHDNIGKDFKFTVSAGGNAMRQTYDFAGMYADQLAQPGIYMISNSLFPAVADPQKSKKALNSLYASTQFSYREKIFLDITGRNDWSSTLPEENNSYFYPSVSTSLLLNEMIQMPVAVSLAKLRFSWAQVGNDASPYNTDKYYDRIYSNSFTNPGTLYNPNLKPEITSSYEAGFDLRLFNNRIGLDLAVYTNNSRNQIIALPVDPISGYNSKVVNAGLINSRGIEAVITGKPILNKNFTWTTTLNWSMNRSYVKELAEGVTSQIIYNHGGNVTIEARVGGRMGDMYGRPLLRNDEGKIIYSATSGLPSGLDPVAIKMGNAFADWKAGLMNEFTLKNFRFSFLLDGQKGGSIWSQTNYKNNSLGKTKVTLPGRAEGGVIGDGVVLNTASGKYEPNTKRVPAGSYYETMYNDAITENNIFDASFLKLREVRIEFSLPKKWLQRLPIEQTSIAIYGRDLFNITNFPAFDPEGGNLNNGTLTPGVELTQFPSTRTMGINLTLKF